MKHINYITILFALTALTATSLNAELVIEDFESYIDTSSLQADVFSFGSAAQAGKPSLAVGLGENDSNAACFNLTWETGNNANLSFINLSPNTQSLSGYAEVTVFIYIEAFPGASGLTEGSAPTIAKLAIEGDDGSIWQTRSVKAERPPVDSSYKLRFRLSPSDMERVEGTGSFKKSIASIKNIRIRFENSRRSGFRQDAYIDSITAVQ
jgi:hypothetical protein